MRIVFFEDNVFEGLLELLERWGYPIDQVVRSMPEFESWKITRDGAYDVAIVDGNLGDYQAGKDGAEICSYLTEHLPDTVRIGYSSDDVRGADHQTGKNITILKQVLESLG